MPEENLSIYPFYCFYCLKKVLYKESNTNEKDKLSFDSIKGKLFPSQKINLTSAQKISLFVTWEIKNGKDEGKNYKLKGCIGTFGKIPLAQGLKEYALHSALNDSRFAPITIKDFSHLRVKCSILHSFETIYLSATSSSNSNIEKKIYDWEVGVHGIELYFNYKGSQYNATFLPEVMVEQEWDQGETFENLIYKAMSNSKFFKSSSTVAFDIIEQIRSNPLEHFVKVIRYQSSIYKCTYEQFIDAYDSL